MTTPLRWRAAWPRKKVCSWVSPLARMSAALEVAKRPENKGKMIVTVVCPSGRGAPRWLPKPVPPSVVDPDWFKAANNRWKRLVVCGFYAHAAGVGKIFAKEVALPPFYLYLSGESKVCSPCEVRVTSGKVDGFTRQLKPFNIQNLVNRGFFQPATTHDREQAHQERQSKTQPMGQPRTMPGYLKNPGGFLASRTAAAHFHPKPLDIFVTPDTINAALREGSLRLADAAAASGTSPQLKSVDKVNDMASRIIPRRTLRESHQH